MAKPRIRITATPTRINQPPKAGWPLGVRMATMMIVTAFLGEGDGGLMF